MVCFVKKKPKSVELRGKCSLASWYAVLLGISHWLQHFQPFLYLDFQQKDILLFYRRNFSVFGMLKMVI
jgi:hypothetical protein